MASQTSTNTISFTSSENVCELMALTTEEITTLSLAYPHVPHDFDLDEAMIDISIMVLNSVIASLHLQYYVGDELVREHAYLILDAEEESYGPPATKPPLGYLPAGTRVRFVVSSNPHRSQDYCEGWYRRLGWRDAMPLRASQNAQSQVYGNFASGGMTIERRLLVNAAYDRPATITHDPW